jgi:hypothetical protein
MRFSSKRSAFNPHGLDLSTRHIDLPKAGTANDYEAPGLPMNFRHQAVSLHPLNVCQFGTRMHSEAGRKSLQGSTDEKEPRAALAKWLLRLPGASALTFHVDRRGLYRVSDLYKGYNPQKSRSMREAD